MEKAFFMASRSSGRDHPGVIGTNGVGESHPAEVTRIFRRCLRQPRDQIAASA